LRLAGGRIEELLAFRRQDEVGEEQRRLACASLTVRCVTFSLFERHSSNRGNEAH